MPIPNCSGGSCSWGSSHRVPELLRAMDVFVLPSVAEGICNSLLEAMASGLPVVATAVGGNPEVVVDGESGLLFPVGDARALANHLALIARTAGVACANGPTRHSAGAGRVLDRSDGSGVRAALHRFAANGGRSRAVSRVASGNFYVWDLRHFRTRAVDGSSSGTR